MQTKAPPELIDLEKFSHENHDLVKTQVLGKAQYKSFSLPLFGLTLGSTLPTAPVLGLFAGVHGLERVGTHVLMSFLKTLLFRMRWEEDWHDFFKNVRLVCIPIINPVGMSLSRRGNGNNVDLMRNSPVDAKGRLFPLVSGHRLGRFLPWYRGVEGELEIETKIVRDFCQKQLFSSDYAISLDIHSGFGFQDRLWYPWAAFNEPFTHEEHVLKLKKLLKTTYPYHVYKVEHQSLNYSNHGDLWDWIYLEHQRQNPRGHFLPLTLEMGSWMWVKKNIWQVFSWEGFFNPIKKHRYARTMRRHNPLLELLLKASRYHENWTK